LRIDDKARPEWKMDGELDLTERDEEQDNDIDSEEEDEKNKDFFE